MPAAPTIRAFMPESEFPAPMQFRSSKSRLRPMTRAMGETQGANVNVVTKSGHQPIPWNRVRVPPRLDFQCQRLFLQPRFLPGLHQRSLPEASIESESVWRRAGRPDQEGQAVLLRQLSGNSAEKRVSSSGFTSANLAPIPAGDRSAAGIRGCARRGELPCESSREVLISEHSAVRTWPVTDPTSAP